MSMHTHDCVRRVLSRGQIDHRWLGLEALESRRLLTAYVVDTTADTVAGDGMVSLREAIMAANTEAVVGDAADDGGGIFNDTAGTGTVN